MKNSSVKQLRIASFQQQNCRPFSHDPLLIQDGSEIV